MQNNTRQFSHNNWNKYLRTNAHTFHWGSHGKQGDLIRIPVVEGENIRRADRNKLMGELIIDAKGIQRDLLAGSEVEITIDIDQSRIIRTKAYIPILDEEFEEILSYDHMEKTFLGCFACSSLFTWHMECMVFLTVACCGLWFLQQNCRQQN